MSYAWGNEPSSEEVTIVSPGRTETLRSTSRIFQIRPNLHHALKHLRQTDTARTLWIDALCINQEDMEERNVQVKRMASIYKLASRVVVCKIAPVYRLSIST